MLVEPLAIPDVKRIVPKVIADARGTFAEIYSKRALAAAGLDLDFVQDNQSMSKAKGVVRGLHFQTPPHAQGKLVRVIRGADPRRRRRPAPGLAHLRPPRVGGAVGGERRAALGAARLRARAVHARAGHRGDLQAHRPLRARLRPRARLGRPGARHRLAGRGGDAILSDRDRKHPTLAELGVVFPQSPL